MLNKRFAISWNSAAGTCFVVCLTAHLLRACRGDRYVEVDERLVPEVERALTHVPCCRRSAKFSRAAGHGGCASASYDHPRTKTCCVSSLDALRDAAVL